MQKGVFFKSVRVMVVIVCALVVAVMLVALRPKAQRQIPPKTGRLVEVISVSPQSISMSIKAFGTIRPREKLLLFAEVGGEVTAIEPRFAEGYCVNKETVLAVIDPVPYALEVERSRGQLERVAAQLKKLEQDVKNLNANLSIAREDIKLAKNEFRRLEDLFESSVSSRANRDRAEQGFLASRVKLQAVENQLALTDPLKSVLESERKIALAALRKAQYNLNRTKITAPFAGWVMEKAIEKGQHVNTGQFMGSIYRANALDVEVSVPLNELRWLRGDKQDLSEFKAVIRLNSNGGDRQWEGRLVRIMAGLDEKTRMQRFVIELERNEAAQRLCPAQVNLDSLRPGMFVEVEIKGNRLENILVLPRYIVRAGDVVFVAEKNTLQIRPVHVVRRQGETVYVDRGITEKDMIIKTPLTGITGGEKIRVQK